MQVVEVEVPEADAELAADALWEAGASAVTEEPRPGARVCLRADVTSADELDDRWAAAVVEPDEEAHLDAWRAYARPSRVGPILVQPTWLPDVGLSGRDGEVVLRLDPGRAFGSGSHPSTRLALRALVDHLPVGASVLDVGCGSGVLAVAAARLGARAVSAIDVDPEAARATLANARANDVVVTVSTTPLSEVPGTFEVVLANIGASVLVDLASSLLDRVAPGGHLVLAGLLVDQADGVVLAYPGAVEVARLVEDGWVALVLRHDLTGPRA